MKNTQNFQYAHLCFGDLVEKINTGNYAVISILCSNISDLITNIKGCDLLSQESDYVTNSKQVMMEIEAYINQRRLLFIPYITDLVQKDTSKHNCSTCSGKCELQHGRRLMDFTMQLRQLKEKINGPFKTSLQMYSTACNNDLKALNDKMILLYNRVCELLYVEEECLLPKIKEAQKNIYAKS